MLTFTRAHFTTTTSRCRRFRFRRPCGVCRRILRSKGITRAYMPWPKRTDNLWPSCSVCRHTLQSKRITRALTLQSKGITRVIMPWPKRTGSLSVLGAVFADIPYDRRGSYVFICLVPLNGEVTYVSNRPITDIIRKFNCAPIVWGPCCISCVGYRYFIFF